MERLFRMRECINDELCNVNEYLLKKLNIYKKSKSKSELILNEKRQTLNEIKKNMSVLSEEEKINDSSELFKPFHKKISNQSEIDRNMALLVSLKEECKNMEVVIENSDNEIKDITYVIEKLFDGQSKLHTNLDNTNNNYSILSYQENENKRISRDLHDSVVQNLTSYIYKIELIQKFIDTDSNSCRLELELLRVNIKKSINELRDIIYNLRPMTFDDIGIRVTLENVITQIKFNNDVKILYKIIESSDTKIEDIDSIISISLLRIIQEACSNAIRHGLSDSIEICITIKNNEIQMSIVDNGKGFHVDNISNQDNVDRGGYGITIMKERVLLLNGKIDIYSCIDKGTSILIKIPLEEKKIGY